MQINLRATLFAKGKEVTKAKLDTKSINYNLRCISLDDIDNNSELTLLVTDILIALNKNNIKYCIERNYDNYPVDRKSTRLNSSHSQQSRMPSSA